MKTKDRLNGRKTLQVNNFLDEFEKDEIKKHIDIIELFKHFGVMPIKKGRGFVALCPWHNDKNPSLSIDKEKGLYNCFGCGESGDVFTLVEKIKGFEFKEALKFLKKFINIEEVTNDNKSRENTQKKEQASNKIEKTEQKKTKENQTQKEQENININLNIVTDYYHKRLIENKAAVEYLESRGFKNKSLIARFKIGFCDGSLKSRLSEEAKKYLLEKGVLTESKTNNLFESFKDCLVFPIFDDLENTVGLYGRSINNKSKVKHLYLKGNHKSVFNYKASKVFDCIILTESIIDALSLIEIGFENVQSIYGTNGFTDEHLKTIKENRVKEIIIALDNDEAGKNSSFLLKDKLLKEGFKVKIISSNTKDWNEDFFQPPPAGITREDFLKDLKSEIETKIEKAETFESKYKQAFTVKKENANYIFTTDELVYRAVGVKDIFVNNLKLNLRSELVTNAQEKYYDNIDLYSARNRTSYSNSLAKQFYLEPKQIEKDLINILEYLEEIRDNNLNPIDNNETQELTEEEKEIGMNFLTSKDMFKQIIEDTETLGYVGDDLNKLLMYIAATSRKTDDPISIIIIAQSASGKSYLVEIIKKLLPPEDLVEATSLSDQALNYMGDLLHKFLDLSEAVHNETIEHQLREMLSAKRLTRIVASKNEKTGKTETTQIKTKAIVSMAMSSTNYSVNPENASRCFVVDTDESREQTKKIHQQQRLKYSLERMRIENNVLPEIKKKHISAQRLLKKRNLINEFAKYLDFPDALMRTRRDHARFIDLIAVVCFLRQYQKQVKLKDGLEYIECDFTDYEIAYKIIKRVLSSSMFEMQKGTIEFYEEMRKIIRKEAKKKDLKFSDVSVIQRTLREKTGLGHTWIKMQLKTLVDYEYIVKRGGERRGSKAFYSLREDEEIQKLDLNMIPTVEEIKQKMNKK
jgi:DNA primase